MRKEYRRDIIIPTAEEAKELLGKELGDQRMRLGEVMSYQPLFKKLKLATDGVHDIFHSARTLVAGGTLARWEQKNGARLRIPEIEVGLIIHDSRRKNDGYDWMHGVRAAKVARGLLAGEMLHNNLRLIELMCAWHVLPDAWTPKQIREIPEMIIFEDSDALDRQGRRGNLNLDYLRLRRSLALVNIMKSLHSKTDERRKETIDPLQIVAGEALDIGLLIQ